MIYKDDQIMNLQSYDIQSIPNSCVEEQYIFGLQHEQKRSALELIIKNKYIVGK